MCRTLITLVVKLKRGLVASSCFSLYNITTLRLPIIINAIEITMTILAYNLLQKIDAYNKSC